MKLKEVLEIKYNNFLKAYQVAINKGKDYSGEEDDLANFKASAILGIAPEKAIMVRIVDKLMRLKNIIDSGRINDKSETFSDTIIDLHNYLDLLYALMLEKEREKNE